MHLDHIKIPYSQQVLLGGLEGKLVPVLETQKTQHIYATFSSMITSVESFIQIMLCSFDGAELITRARLSDSEHTVRSDFIFIPADVPDDCRVGLLRTDRRR